MPGGKKRGGSGGDRGGRGGGSGGSPQKKGGDREENKEFKFDFGNAPQKFDFGAKGEGEKKGGEKQERGGFQLSEEAQAALVPMIQKRLNTLIGKSSGYFETLPPAVQNRIKVLKKLHMEKQHIDADYKKELAELEKKFKDKFDPLYVKRSKIIQGEVEPSSEEIAAAEAEIKKKEEEEDKKKSGEGEEKEEKEEKKGEKEEKKEEAKPTKAEETKETKTEEPKTEVKDVKGIPQFWMQALMHHEDTGQLITKKDEEALQYLTDLKVAEVKDEEDSFSLEFHFAENPFLENKVLLKTYHLEYNEHYGDVMFDHVESSEIEWKPNKNLTVKKVTQTVGGRGKGRRGGKKGGGKQTQVVEVPTQSFFNFFSPDATIAALEEEEELDENEIQYVLEEDYELGCIIKDQIIPNGVLWFTGEANDESDDDEEGGFGGMLDDEEGEYNSDEDPDFTPDPNAPPGQQPECKQQ